MSTELQAVYGTVVILLALLAIQGALAPITHGFRWGLGPRDGSRIPSLLQGRMNRIVANHLEGMAMFVPLVLIAALEDVSTPLTQSGAVIFLAARAAFALIYAFGVPVWRSVAWGFSLVGLFMIGIDLTRSGF